MHTKRIFVEQVAAVRAAAIDPESAYLVRTRLKRALLTCTGAAATAAGLQPPIFPMPWTPPSSASAIVHEVALTCNGILGDVDHLCQPSEALDVRWEQGWARVSDGLERLEYLVAQL